MLHLQIASGHLAHQHYDYDGEESPPNKKRRGGTGAGRRMERPRGVAAQFRRTDVSDVKEVRSTAHLLQKKGQKDCFVRERERNGETVVSEEIDGGKEERRAILLTKNYDCTG